MRCGHALKPIVAMPLDSGQALDHGAVLCQGRRHPRASGQVVDECCWPLLLSCLCPCPCRCLAFPQVRRPAAPTAVRRCALVLQLHAALGAGTACARHACMRMPAAWPPLCKHSDGTVTAPAWAAVHPSSLAFAMSHPWAPTATLQDAEAADRATQRLELQREVLAAKKLKVRPRRRAGAGAHLRASGHTDALRQAHVCVCNTSDGLGRDMPHRGTIFPFLFVFIIRLSSSFSIGGPTGRLQMQAAKWPCWRVLLLWHCTQTGDVLEGVVANVTAYGAFVDVGGVRGLLHVRHMSKERVLDVASIMKPGDTIKVGAAWRAAGMAVGLDCASMYMQAYLQSGDQAARESRGNTLQLAATIAPLGVHSVWWPSCWPPALRRGCTKCLPPWHGVV